MSANNGKPCIKCGGTDWYSCGGCARCSKQRSKKWREINKDNDRVRQYNIEKGKRYRAENPEKIRIYNKQRRRKYTQKDMERSRNWKRLHRESERERTRAWRQEHRGFDSEYKRKYKKENRELYIMAAQKRRTKKASAGGFCTTEEWKSLVARSGNKCLRCGKSGISLTVDHIIPVSLGGTSDISNLQPLCKSCNSSKGTKTVDYRRKPLEELDE